LQTKFGALKILDAERAQEILSYNSEKNCVTFHFVNAFVLAKAQKDQTYFQILSEGYCFCDSRPLEIYSRFVKSPISQLRGFDFLKENLPNPSSGTQLIIGGTQRSEKEVIQVIERFFQKKLPISFHQPDFSSDISLLRANSMQAIELNDPKTVWLGVGTPKQDFLANRLRAETDVNLFCVGAAIAFLVGDFLESPRWMQILGLEWLFRFIREPRRLWKRYLLGNFQFLGILLKDRIARIVQN
jgi:N-acetylglucosaminyldiphosphoundecaprenol N-acetyl-beta-D-mannosaminyltransferase